MDIKNVEGLHHQINEMKYGSVLLHVQDGIIVSGEITNKIKPCVSIKDFFKGVKKCLKEHK